MPIPFNEKINYARALGYCRHVVKCGEESEPAYSLAGMLYAVPSGWVLLSVPNGLIRGLFSALAEPGIELPTHEGKLNAHIPVFSPKEVKKIGGLDAITERGKFFRYSLGRLESTQPEDWPGIDRIWFLRVYSPELQALRRSYGLSSLPEDGRKVFHILVARRKRGVLSRSDTAKNKTAAIHENYRPLKYWQPTVSLRDVFLIFGKEKTAEEKNPENKPVLAVSISGVIAQKIPENEKNKNPSELGPVNSLNVELLKKLQNRGVKIVLISKSPKKSAVLAWLAKHNVPFDDITSPRNSSGKKAKIFKTANVVWGKTREIYESLPLAAYQKMVNNLEHLLFSSSEEVI